MSELTQRSPFLTPKSTSSQSSLAIVYLSRENALPTVLRERPEQDTGYAEGNVATTRFGSFPHSTLINQPWGSQIAASRVDTGSRGHKSNKKRKIEPAGTEEKREESPPNGAMKQQKVPVAAASGFCHVLDPTPELWTSSLPHRTQVVYTPDYSFIIEKMRIRPGSVVIEAGAGSGSFTHAAARAVFNGYTSAESNPPSSSPEADQLKRKPKRYGKVYSFEYHEQRAHQLQAEISEHSLDDIVQITHQDVCEQGFLIPAPPPNTTEQSSSSSSPNATQVFLDLPSPWLALPHLTRRAPSPLNPQNPIHLTAFQPCIEQAQRTITSLRNHGWVEISMYELAHRRIDVRRERVGLAHEGLRGVNAGPADVGEAVDRLMMVARNSRAAREVQVARAKMAREGKTGAEIKLERKDGEPRESRAARLERIKKEAESRKTYKEGRLVCRTEPEIKTHTSYLVFAVLPREWTEADEDAARRRFGG